MGESWVVNASPLIALAKVGHLELLTGLARDILLPEPVVYEILAGPAADPARIAIAAGWGRRVLADRTAPQVLEWSLGAGESAVLTVALEVPDRRAVLDDAEGRRCARALGIPLIGTLGIVLRAKRAGLVASAAELIRTLRLSGLFLDEQIVEKALREAVGEEWHP